MSVPSIEALTAGKRFSACTAALTKNDMNPRRVPCSFSKRSWYFLRISITGAMFTSLKVVRIAAVDCDCTTRSATRRRCSRGWGLWRRCAGGSFGLGVDLRDDVARADGVLRFSQYFYQNPVGRGGQLEHHLVGLDVDQVLVARDRLAFLLVPVEKRRFGDGFGKLRHLHFDNRHHFSRSVFPRLRLSFHRVMKNQRVTRRAYWCD